MNTKKKFGKATRVRLYPDQHKALMVIHRSGGPVIAESIRLALAAYLAAMDEAKQERFLQQLDEEQP